MGVVIKTMCDVLDRIEEKGRMEVAGYYTGINRDDRNIHTQHEKDYMVFRQSDHLIRFAIPYFLNAIQR